MKELYIAPTAELIRFVSKETIASGSVDFSDLVQKPASYDDGDINIEF